MTKELPICLNPNIKTYSYYAFAQCIIMAPERIGQQVAEFEIVEDDKFSWKSIELDKTPKGTWLLESKDQYNRNCNGIVYRKLEKNSDHIHINVLFQQYSEPWAAINVFFASNEKEMLLGDNSYDCRFGHFIYDGLNFYTKGKYNYIQKKKLKTPYSLVLSIKDNVIELFAGEKEIVKVGEKKINIMNDKDYYIGVQVRHEDNSFYPWFYSNFIQISSDVTCTHRRLDYYSFFKNWDYDLVNYFLDYNHYTCEEIMKLGGANFVKQCIRQGKYIELKLDQYYICDRDEYKSFHFLHQNLVYGFDGHEFLILGYNNSGKIKKMNISFSKLNLSLKENVEATIKIISYCQGAYFYRYKPSFIKKSIEDYLHGVNTSEVTHEIIPMNERKHGMLIYEDLLSEQGLKVIIDDLRVAYLLWEHKNHMRNRIKYLYVQGQINEEDWKRIDVIADQVVNQSYNLLNITQKYRICPKKRNDILLKEWINELRDKEESMLKMLCDKWVD